jgi:hypothetical protein
MLCIESSVNGDVGVEPQGLMVIETAADGCPGT